MELIVIKTNLKEGLNIIQGGVGESLNLPVLKYAILEAEHDKIRLTATNLELSITSVVSGKVIEGGRVGVPVGTLLSLINNIQTERISLQSKKGQVSLKTDNYEASIQSIPPDDFPVIPSLKEKSLFFEIDGEEFKEALSQVVVATQFSDLRPELNSVLFDFSIDSLRLVATDSFRLSERTIANTYLKTNLEDRFRALIPLRACHELIKIINNEAKIGVYFSGNQVFFESERFELVSRLTEGNFPDYTQVLPKKYGSEVVVNREKLINALKLAGVFGGQNNEARVKVLPGAKTLEVESSSQDVGDNRYVLAVKATKETGEVAFNGKYLIDALRAIKTEDVFIGINEEERRASLVKSSTNDAYLYVLMPILKA